MKAQSKFEHGVFYGDDYMFFAVNKQKYTREQALELFAREIDSDIAEAARCLTGVAAVTWRAGIVDNEPHVCWWIDFEHDGTEPRYCPVWAFQLGA